LLGQDDGLVRRFLLETHPLFDGLSNWGIARWDVHRFTGRAAAELSGDRAWTRLVRIWEDGGRIAGFVTPEGDSEAHLQIHPEHRHVEQEMVAWVEANWPAEQVVTWGCGNDSFRRELLRGRGWEDHGVDGFTHRRSLSNTIPGGSVAAGYTVRSVDLASPDDAAHRAAISRAVFGGDRTAALTAVLRNAPTYRPDLDLAVIAPDGTFAANTTAWWDEANRHVEFEPVGTHPDHRRQRLASAVIAEGMRRAKALGATTAYVGSGTDPAARALYASLGFVEADAHVRYGWRRGA
jgi:predicted N-acetyltransferase YhbS